MAEPITKLEDLSANVRSVIEANAGNELIPVSRDASGVITEYRQMSPQEYLSSKGGITRAGFFGNDVAEGRGMSDEQYFGLLKSGGVEGLNKFNEDKIRAEETQKLISRYTSQGLSAADAAKKTDEFFAEAAASLERGYEIDENGNKIPLFGPGSSFTGSPSTPKFNTSTTLKTKGLIPTDIDNQTRDAFAAMQDLFTSYGLESLAGEISSYMTQGFTAAEALIKLKTNPTGAYSKRFAGNFARTKNGLNAVSEAEYINLENSYADTLKAYGLGNMVSVNRDDNYKTFANYIAGDISAVEFKDRVSTVVTRVQNADPSIKATLKSFYPEISDADLVSYFLNPKQNLPKLQEKVTASEIGAAAVGAGAGLTTNVNTATSLARYGVDQATAREGYSTIAGILPTASKLGDIYNEAGVKYTQAEGEAEVFMGRQDAASKRNRLASMERGSFGGSAGNAPGAYSTGYLKKSSTAGLI